VAESPPAALRDQSGIYSQCVELLGMFLWLQTDLEQ
jgi:hypothetical protein